MGACFQTKMQLRPRGLTLTAARVAIDTDTFAQEPRARVRAATRDPTHNGHTFCLGLTYRTKRLCDRCGQRQDHARASGKQCPGKPLRPAPGSGTGAYRPLRVNLWTRSAEDLFAKLERENRMAYVRVEPLLAEHPAFDSFNESHRLVAARRIPEDHVIGEYVGVVKLCAHHSLSRSAIAQHNRFALDIGRQGGRQLIIDASESGNYTRFINDFRNTKRSVNVRATTGTGNDGRPVAFIVTTRAIPKGEELLLDYGEGYWASIKIPGNNKPH